MPAVDCFKRIKELGFNELDLTVRQGGYVEPENLDADFETVSKAWEKAGIKPGLFTTNITAPDSPKAKDIIAAAAKHSVPFIKLGYCHARFGHLKEDMAEWHRRVTELVPIAEKHNVTLLIHVHSANFFGALPFHWIPLFEKIHSPALGMYLDPCHHHLEGSLQGWHMAMEMARDIVRVVAVKDYRWSASYPRTKEGHTYPLFTRLEKGWTPWNQVVYALKTFGFNGPFSIHGEYSDADRHRVPEAMKQDLQYFKNLWENDKGEPLDLNKEAHLVEE